MSKEEREHLKKLKAKYVYQRTMLLVDFACVKLGMESCQELEEEIRKLDAEWEPFPTDVNKNFTDWLWKEFNIVDR